MTADHLICTDIMGKSLTSSGSDLNAAVTVPLALYEQGSRLCELGDYEGAIACFDQVIELAPMHSGAWVFRGVALLHLERYDEALDCCQQAIQLNPQDAEAWLFHGVALQRTGQYRSAYASYERALGHRRQPLWQFLKNLLSAGRQTLARAGQRLQQGQSLKSPGSTLKNRLPLH